MSEKRFNMDKSGDLYDKNNLLMLNFGYSYDGVGCKRIIDLLNELNDENEQLKKDATTLIYANQDYRQQNQNLQEQLDYIQNLISEHIRHQKTELGVKALQEIIVDYNEWMLGHKEAKK